MEPLYVMSLASKQSSWLGVRQQIIATNVANADTPGFKAADVRPFSDSIARAAGNLVTTSPNHLQISAAEASSVKSRQTDGWDVTLSGNSVSLEQEMLKAGEVHRAFALNTSIVKAFNSMILSSVKG